MSLSICFALISRSTTAAIWATLRRSKRSRSKTWPTILSKYSSIFIDSPTFTRICKALLNLALTDLRRVTKRFLHFLKLDILSKYFINKDTRDSYGSAGYHESNSIEFLNACNEKHLDKLKQLRPFVDINVCDNNGYSPLIIAVVTFVIVPLFARVKLFFNNLFYSTAQLRCQDYKLLTGQRG